MLEKIQPTKSLSVPIGFMPKSKSILTKKDNIISIKNNDIIGAYLINLLFVFPFFVNRYS